ncbi:histone-lysine N-methyltransferase 2C-like [Vanacampus margaritifer]
MPSEDRRAPPPVTRAGRKAAASEKRPRGRPRKDGVGGRAAPPPPPPPPPPTPKSRKKGRSRGQAQVEDEEDVDTMAKTPPLDKMAAAVTTGRRGSASRRRSNTDPTPAIPEAPPNEPTISLAPPPPSISEEEPPQTSPIAPSEEEPPQTSPIAPSPPPQSPIPSAAPAEAEMGGASPASSPERSPHLRLEDDDALSPLLRRSMSEDSGSPTPSLGHTERRLQQCAFCYRGERPPLGQGPLVVFGPTPGYIPLHVLSRRTSSDRDGDCHDHCYPRGQAVHTNSSSPAQSDDESSFQLVEQLGAIGLPLDIDVQSLFDPTGQCCAHLQCASWSEGVCRGEGQSLLYVDKAIDSGSTQVCVFCGGLGASLCCRETGCGRNYHFPCAAAAGAHQDWEQRHTLCTRHAHTASRSCVSCSRGDDVSSLLMCCCCGSQYHATCLAPPLNPSPLIRAGWQCAPCRVCQSCRLRENDTSVLLVCARCDKSYHAHCLTPPLDHTPDSKWTCQNCRVCLRCGVRSSGHWANHPFLCVSCDPALPCAVCGHTPDLYSLQDYVTCVCCYRCVHTQCVSIEGGVNATKCDSKSYVCSACQHQRAELPTALAVIIHSPARDVQLTPTHAPDVESPTEVLPISTTAHSPVQLACSEQAQTPTEGTRLLHENPVPSPSHSTEFQRSPTPSSSSPTQQRLNLVLSLDDPTELHESPTSSPSNSNEQKLSLVLSPSDPSEIQQSPTSSPASPTELNPSPQSSPSHVTEPQQILSPEHTPPDHTELRLSLVLSPSDPTELQQSPESSSSPSHTTELRLSPTQSPCNSTDLQQSPEQSSSNSTLLRQCPLASPENLTVLRRSPTPSLNHTELHQSPSSSPQKSLAASSFNPTQLGESPPQYPSEHVDFQPLNSHPTELRLSPVSSPSNTTEFQKGPVPSPSNKTDHQQSPIPSPSNATEPHASPTPSPSNVTELHPSPVPSSSEPTDFQQSPVPSLSNNTELQQSPLPCPKVTEVHQSRTPSPDVTELHLSPVPSSSKSTQMQQSPVPSPSDAKDLYTSPVQTPSDETELQQSALPTPNIIEFKKSQTPFPSSVTDLHLIPVSSPSKPTEFPQSPVSSPNTTDLHLSPAQSPSNVTALHSSPVPFPNITEIPQSPTPSPSSSIPMPSPNTTDLHPTLVPFCNVTQPRQSPIPSPSNTNELQRSPVPSPSDITEMSQCPSPSPSKITELQQSPIPSPSKPTEFQQNQVTSSNVTELHQSPVLSHSNISESQHSPTQSFSTVTEIPNSPTLSPSNIQDLQLSPKPISSNVTMLHQSPLPSPSMKELHQSPVPSPSNITELHKSPVPSPSNITELHKSPVPSPSEITELHKSPVPSPSEITELHKSPVPSPSEITELHKSPVPSPSEITELHKSPVPSPSEITELHKSPVPSPSEITELHLSPVPSPSEITKLHQSPATSPTNVEELHQSPATSPPNVEELHQSPVPTPNITELNKSPVPSPSEITELYQSPVTSPHVTELQRSPTPSTSNVTLLHQSPVTSSDIANTSPVSSSAIPAELQLSPGPSPSFPAESHESPVSLPSKAAKSLELAPLLVEKSTEEPQKLTAPSYPCGADLQQSTLQPSSCPAELVTSHLSCFETTECHKSPAVSQLRPIQDKEDPQVNHVPWECKEIHGRSPVPHLCSTPPPLPSVIKDMQQSAVLLTSTPAQLSPPASPSIDSIRGKLATRASPKSPVQDSSMSELNPWRLDDDEAKSGAISPEGHVQEDGSQLIISHDPTDESPLLQSHPGRCIPEPHCPTQVGTSPRKTPPRDVETAPEQENNSSHFIACKLNQGLSPGSKPSAYRPRSAPCSPSRTPLLSSTPRSLSEPVSPARMSSPQPARPLQLSVAQPTVTMASSQGVGTDLEPVDIPHNRSVDVQALESVVCSSATVMPAPPTLSHSPSSPLRDLPSPAPESLVHQSTSVDHSSLSHMSSDVETAEDVPCHHSDSLDCTTQGLKPTEQQARPVHIHTRASGASPANSLQASWDLMTEVTDPATVKQLPARTSPSSRPGSPVMPTDRTSLSPANSSSEFETGPASVGDCSPADRVHDPESPQLPQSGRSSPLTVPACSSPSETKPSHSTRTSPTHCRPVDDSSDSQTLSKIVLESSLSFSNQRCSPTPSQAAAPSSPAGSIHSSPEADAQAASREQNSFHLDSAADLTSDPSWKTKTKSPSCLPGDSFAASQARTTYLRQFPAPSSPLNDRPASSPTQEHTDMHETRHRTENWNQLMSPLQLDNAQIALSVDKPETSKGSAVQTCIQLETGPCSGGHTSAVLSEEESASIVTTDQGVCPHLHQYLPEKAGEVSNQEENVDRHQEEIKQPMQEENMEQCQEELQNREEVKEQNQDENEEQMLENREQHQEERSRCFPSGVHPSAGQPAAASPFSGLPSPSSPSPSGSPLPSPAALQHGDVSSEVSPLNVPADAPSEWPQEDSSCSQNSPEATKDVAQSHAGSPESTPDVVAFRPSHEEARESSSDGEGEPEASFDVEVMKLMSSSSPSASPCRPSSLSPPPLNTRSLRPPPRSLPPSDELSIRLRQSPFSTEASPETSPVRVPLTPPPLSPPSPLLSFSPPYRESPPLCKTPPCTSTVIPLTRKIGMGKPAISKRKFSPGRARARQGSWWSNARAVSPPSSSQDSMGEGDRDSPKSRQADSPLWSMRVGRGSGFSGRRRSRGGGGVGGGRGGRGRSRIKTQDFLSVSPAYGIVESVPPKEEEENSMHNTVVMFSTSDVFTLRQDMCVVCGSFGQGAEGRLLACSQCGQCYHPYCVNVKVTRVILTKGWRCLECTVCEACGEATDPGRLLLCDDCDISYHTYCLDPPLHTVPKGAWKCKWCVWCVQCGSASPGLHCDWQSNYSHCGPCASLTCCPLCQRAYTHDDLILQCQQCDRWVHAACEGLTTEDDVEVTADEGFDCSLCRTHSRIPFGRPDNLDLAQILSRSREADTKTYSQDGVCLTESGLSQLQSLVEPLTSTRRYRRCKPKLKLRIINQNSVSVLQTPPHPDTGHMECDLKSDSSPEREPAPEDDVSKDMAKRKRKPYRPGIGGFMVRQRGGKTGAGAFKICGGRHSSETLQGDEDGAEQTVDKVKKRYRKKKTKLEEAFPSYLQEAFFGRDLLYRIRQVDQRMLSEAARISQSGAMDCKGPSPSEKLINAKQERLLLSDEALVDLCDVLTTHPHIVAGGHSAGLDISSVSHDPLLTSEVTGGGGQGQKALHEEPLDAILNPELDKMVTDVAGALLSKLYKIPELEGKDVEDLFTAVLSPNGSQQHNQNTQTAAGGKTHTVGAGAFPRLALLNGLACRAPSLDDMDTIPGGPVRVAVPCPPPTNQAAGEGEHDGMSTAQRSMMKWEKEEALGEQATVAPVLYCNTNFPQLREQYPEWSTRVKQIAKLWRKASSQDRAPYVQRARDNRAAQRISKVHLYGEPPKHTQSCQPPLQGPYDDVCPDAADSALRDPLKPRESELEQEWKLRQQMRQKSKQLAKIEATQKLEQVKSEQRQQQLSANQRPDTSPDACARQNLLQGSPLADDVFLRPHAPPPSGYSPLPHSPRSPHSSSSPLQQHPSSPQMFSPPSSRPTSPWDPYSKPAGTPRPASIQRCPSLSISPAHDALGSPVPSPDSKSSDPSRTLTLQPGLQHSRAAIKSPPSGSQVYHRPQIQGGVFKAPMPPQNQLQQDLFGGATPGARREPSRPADIGLPQSQDRAFHSGLGSPQRGPYTLVPGTPNQQMADPYTNPPTSGLHCDSSYLPSASLALRLDHLKMSSGHPSPSHPTSDPYPSLAEHFPRSPGGTLTSDPYAKAPGTPRPSPDPYTQQPSTPDPQKTPEAFGQAQVDNLAPRLMRSPLGGDSATRKQSPQQDSFTRIRGSNQTPKHPGTSDHRSPAAHLTSGASPMDKTAAADMAAVGVASLEGPMGLLPQLGDSEEKLRQRQRLRQLILRQQQQKSALRQEKGLQEAGTLPVTPGPGPAPGVATPHHWTQDAANTPPTDVFGRPPPPYPGMLRLPGPAAVHPGAFLGEQLRGLTPRASPFPVPRGTPLRFGPQDSFPRPPLTLGTPTVAPVQTRKPLPGELIAIRPLTAASPHPHILSATPQAFPGPCALPVQQHSIMGQPYIELRHRAPENRLRLPFSLVPGLTSDASLPSGRMGGETVAGQPVLLMVQLNQQDQQNLVQTATALAQGTDVALQGGEGIEEHLEGVESAVKDLEDVEVKDLVDLNLNLDPEDGKEDLDLGPNDLHLDDFLLSGKFDLIAYADPELNLEDKKDMFNEELELGESVGDPKKGAPRKMDNSADLIGQVKEEYEESIQVDPQNRSTPLPPPQHPRKIPGPDGHIGLARASGAEAVGSNQPGSSLHLSKGESGESVCGSGTLPEVQVQGKVPSYALTSTLAPGSQPGFQPSAAGPSSAYLAPHPLPSRCTPAPPAPQGLPPGSSPRSLPLQLPQPCLLPQAQPVQRDVSAQGPTQTQDQSQNENKGKALLLEEQPLLLQDLLDQERQEQQQQKQMQALIRHKSTSETGIPDLADFDSISDPIMKAKMVALKGINKVMSQGNLGLNNMVINRFHQGPAAATAAPEVTSQPPLPVTGQDADLNTQLVRPNPPNFGPGFVNDSQRHQYEEWLGETQRLLQMQQRLLEEQLAAHRKIKKALSAKQRTAKKAGRVLAEDDAAQLRYVVEQQAAVQKQLEQIRKQQKDHTVLIEDYRNQQRQQRTPTNVPAVVLTQNTAPLQSGIQNVPTAWSALMAPNLPSHPPPQTPPALSTTPLVSTIVPGIAAPAADFVPGIRGPVTGHGGASGGDLSTPAPQVKFDDNNPFSEGFQERERRERLREQQERHRVQLMQGVERQRVLQQQRLDLDQPGHSGTPGGTRLCPAGLAVGGTLGPTPSGDTLSQIPFFSSELPQDFLQSPPRARPPTLGGQPGAPFPLPQQGFTGGPLPHGAGASPEQRGVLPVEATPHILQTKQRPAGSLAQVLPLGALPTPPNQTGQGHTFGPDSASSSPSATLRAPFSSSSMPQLYADILPNDGPKRRRSMNRDGGARTPLSTHSDDMAAPPTPALSDTSCSTPTRGGAELTNSNPSALVPSSELERQLSVCSADAARGRMEVKEEREERGDPVNPACTSPLHDPGKELLRQLLKEKASPEKAPSPGGHAPPAFRHRLSGDSTRSEDEDGAGFHGNAPDVLDLLARKKPQRCKRTTRPDKDKNPSKCKRRRQEDEDEDALDYSSSPSDQVVTHLTQLSVLPLMEPVLRLDLSLFPPYGSSSLGRDSRLSGTFGNACLDGVADYYTQLACKNILGNPPTPPASLPPTPPPVAKQKLLNGFATADEVSRKDGKCVPSHNGEKRSATFGSDLVASLSEVKGATTSKGEELRRATETADMDVDVPASLPTPPHNNQEELRVQDSSRCGSPDGYVPSSSPESVADMEVSRYPDLSFVKTETLSPCPSPPIPIMPCSWGKGSALKREVKTEPDHQAPPSCSNSDLVTIAITLNPTASQNVPGVMATVAKLLRLPASINYQLSRDPLTLLAGVSVPLPQATSSSRQQRTAPPTGVRMGSVQRGSGGAPTPSRPPSCSFCKVLLGNGVRKIRETKEEGRPSLLFCSPNCSALYSSGLKGGSAADEPAAPPPAQHRYENNMSSIAVHSLPVAPARAAAAAAASPPPRFPSASTVTMETKPRMDGLKVKVKLKPHPHAFSEGDDSLASQHTKRMKSSRWRRWNVNVALSRGPISDKAVAVPTEDEVDVLLKKLGACLRLDPFPVDQRRCCFCHQQGDGETDGPARLLNLDLDLWVHLNCALWSSEVYETQAGALINVELALRRGLALRCAHCQQTGATSGCNRLRCTNTYHFTCAIRAHCTFFKDKTMLCQLHRPRTGPASSPSSAPGPPTEPCAWTHDPYDSELRCFAVFRRVYVQRDEARQVAAMVQRGEWRHSFRVGSLLFCAVGRLLPRQMSAFHAAAAIYPVGYHANRIYWSMRHSNRRCEYMCFIEEQEARPLFKVRVVENGYDDLILTAPTPKGVWEQILEPVAHLRSSSGMLKLFPNFLKGEDLFGLSSSAVCRIIESLPGVESCEGYTFRFGRNPLMEWPLAFNPSGSARSEPKASQAKRPYLLTSMAPRCQGSVGSIVGAVPGVISLSPGETVAGAHQGRHSKLAQYRRMKADWKTNVYLARSRIQGLGLYAARDIEKCTMVIEYIGTIIRSEVANRKERLYESQNRGVYMFRIDNDYVIDATITGGPARYINHSCAPNCITEVVSIEKENKIIISSCRRIQRGEELSYDYKFDLEDDQHKIPCHCGALNCRKWMN